MRLSLLLFLGLLLLAAGCAGGKGDLKGGAEESSEQNESDSLPSLLPANLEHRAAAAANIAALVANPSAFEGRLLQVEGLFTSTTGFICTDNGFSAPASWALAAGQQQIAAGGLEQLAAALPDGQITLVVEGVWRSWPIPANCRQEGDPSELYYLEVVQVISPNPIALAPGKLSAVPLPQLAPTDTLPAVEQPEVNPTTTPIPSPVPPLPATPDPGGYPPPVAIPIIGGGSYPGPAPTAPVPAGPTSVPAAEVPLDRQPLDAGSLETGALGPGISERWPYVITATQTIDLQIMPDAGLELIVTILDQNGQVLSAGSTTAPGQKVTLQAVNLPQPGEFAILVTTLASSSGNYAILLSDEDTYDFLFQQNLPDAATLSGQLLPENDHFYFFYGSAGDVVDLTARPTAGANLFLRLFSPSGTMLLSMHDESPAGQEEQIAAYTLPATGLYSLLVGESAFAGGAYTVVLNRR